MASCGARCACSADPFFSGLRFSLFRSYGMWRAGTGALRIVAGSPDSSGLVVRMGSRERNDQMPPIATKHVDPTGLEVVSAWIRGLR